MRYALAFPYPAEAGLAPSWTAEVARGREDGPPQAGGSVYNAPDPRIQNQNRRWEGRIPNSAILWGRGGNRLGADHGLVAEFSVSGKNTLPRSALPILRNSDEADG
jgi:hypothetical protein